MLPLQPRLLNWSGRGSKWGTVTFVGEGRGREMQLSEMQPHDETTVLASVLSMINLFKPHHLIGRISFYLFQLFSTRINANPTPRQEA